MTVMSRHLFRLLYHPNIVLFTPYLLRLFHSSVLSIIDVAPQKHLKMAPKQSLTQFLMQSVKAGVTHFSRPKK